MEIKMSCNNISFLIIGWTLYRTEFIDIIHSWNNNHSGRMLSGSSSDTCTSGCKSLFFSLTDLFTGYL